MNFSAGIGKGYMPPESTSQSEVTEEQCVAATRTVCALAEDAEDAAVLLKMLGLL